MSVFINGLFDNQSDTIRKNILEVSRMYSNDNIDTDIIQDVKDRMEVLKNILSLDEKKLNYLKYMQNKQQTFQKEANSDINDQEKVIKEYKNTLEIIMENINRIPKDNEGNIYKKVDKIETRMGDAEVITKVNIVDNSLIWSLFNEAYSNSYSENLNEITTYENAYDKVMDYKDIIEDIYKKIPKKNNSGGTKTKKYKQTDKKVLIIFKGKKMQRNIYLNNKTQYCKINNEYILLSKLNKTSKK